MCLYIREGTTKRIAKRAITVYKVLSSTRGELRSVYQGTPGWYKGYMFYGPKLESPDGYRINQGLHAFTALKRAKELIARRHVPGRFVVYAMQIPKGTEYYVGEDRDIVARKLWFPAKGKQLAVRHVVSRYEF